MPDRTNEYRDEIYRRACALIDSGDLDSIKAMMTATEEERFNRAISVICACRTVQSMEYASAEVSEIVHEAAKRLAEIEYKRDMKAAAEKLAVERYYRMAAA